MTQSKQINNATKGSVNRFLYATLCFYVMEPAGQGGIEEILKYVYCTLMCIKKGPVHAVLGSQCNRFNHFMNHWTVTQRQERLFLTWHPQEKAVNPHF